MGTLNGSAKSAYHVCIGVAQRAGPLFEVAAQAEAVEPEMAEAADAGRRATADLCKSFWVKAATDGLLADEVDPAQLAIATDILVCADTVVHLRRTHAWSAGEHRALMVEALTRLARRS